MDIESRFAADSAVQTKPCPVLIALIIGRRWASVVRMEHPCGQWLADDGGSANEQSADASGYRRLARQDLSLMIGLAGSWPG